MTAIDDTILKCDRRGRLRYSAEQKTAMVDAYQSSGLSGPWFAALHGVNYQTLATWLAKRKRAAPRKPAGLPHPVFLSLIPAELESPADSAAPMEVFLPGGVRLSITSARQALLAAALIRELEASRSC